MSKNLISTIKNGGIAVLLTDTIYGICTSALNKKSVEQLYDIRKRDKEKAVIILIDHISKLSDFGIKLNKNEELILNKLTPSPLTFLLEENTQKFNHLKGNSKYLSFRIPNKTHLLNIIERTGAIIAPSANIQGEKPAKNIAEAKKYFGNKVDYYDDSGTCLNSVPSTVAIFEKSKFEIIRQGKFDIPTKYLK